MNTKKVNIVLGKIQEIQRSLDEIRIGFLSLPDNSVLQRRAHLFFDDYLEAFNTARVQKWLAREEIETVRQVTEFTWNDLARRRNLGPVCIRYIERCLAKHGLHLKDIA